MTLLSVEEAQLRLIASAPMVDIEIPSLADAIGRWLADDVQALRDQPWTALSAMDGYAIRHQDLPGPWTVVGESAAGNVAAPSIQSGEAVRIFTGAPMPAGADCVLVQEEAELKGLTLVLAGEGPSGPGRNVRQKSSDFCIGKTLLGKGAFIGAPQVALAALGGYGTLPVPRKLRVALFTTGDELADPGKQSHPGELPASNSLMLRAMLSSLPVLIEDLGIIRDDLDAQSQAFSTAASADIIVTTGGASVGDHDLIRPAFEASGGSLDFWRIALRPGKPLMAGRNGNAIFLGLPGNPVSAFVTATLFLLPLVRHMSGSPHPLPVPIDVRLEEDMPPVAARAAYVRAILSEGAVRSLPDQDSAGMTALANANALIIRPSNAAAARAGDMVRCLLIG